MKKAKKLFGIVLAIAMVFNVFAIAAVAETKDVAHVDVSLQVGRYDVGTKVFTPLTPGEDLSKDDVITVRVAPESNFCVGAQCYPVMFDKSKFEVVGGGATAFTVNEDNTYVLASNSSSGATDISNDVWPASFAEGERYDAYKVIKATFMFTSGDLTDPIYPVVLPGTWLFQFNLKATQAIVSGSDARIFLDNRWFRAPASTGLTGYITKYDGGTTIAEQGVPSYAYERDFTGADIKLPTEVTESTITFVTGGGTVIAPLIGNIGSLVIAPPNPTRANYVFKGWLPALPAIQPDENMDVTAQWVMLGDTNLDGFILAGDALRALRASNETITLTGDAAIAADANRDGYIVASDALKILRYSNGTITVFS